MDFSPYPFELDRGTRYRLKTIRWPSGEQWNYTYDATPGKLIQVDDNYLDGSGNALRKLVFNYDGSNRLQYVGDQTFNLSSLSGRYVQFSYSTDAGGTALLSGVRDARGQSWTYSYSASAGQVDFLTQRL